MPRKKTAAAEAAVIETQEDAVAVPPQMQEFVNAACDALRERGEAIDVRSISAEVKRINPRGRSAGNYILMAAIDAWEAEQHAFGQVDERVLAIFADESDRMARRLYGRIHEIAASEWEAERRSYDEDRRRHQVLKGVTRDLEDELTKLKAEAERLKPFEQALADAKSEAALAEERHKTAMANARAEGFKEAMALMKGDDAPAEKPKRAPRKAKTTKAEAAPAEDDTPAEEGTA